MRELYVKKAIPVQAIQWNGPEDNEKVMPAIVDKINVDRAGGELAIGFDAYRIQTLEGWLNLVPGSYIVGPGHKGEYWPVDREIFEATYQKYEQ